MIISLTIVIDIWKLNETFKWNWGKSKVNDKKYLHSDLTEQIISAFYLVYRHLGYGFLEKVYENAMLYEMELMGLKVEAQKQIDVIYKDFNVGTYFADLLVDNRVIVELKAQEFLHKEHYHQLTNYLKATEYEVGLLINFGKNPELRRFCYTNGQKQLRRTRLDSLPVSINILEASPSNTGRK
ncbi:MAG TPA: hypothetical protein DG355_01475 [Candidatus Cloacimonas sp.]|jgi:GxxExxY protein|nr:hypothetical protein [Candidatus Cloacimonas sp.]